MRANGSKELSTPTSKQISRKTTWSAEDAAELELAIGRARSKISRIRLRNTRAAAIAEQYPHEAIALYEESLSERDTLTSNQTQYKIVDIHVQLGDIGAGVALLQSLLEKTIAEDTTGKDLSLIHISEPTRPY